MERVSIIFHSEEIKPFQLHPNQVPDVLLPKVWFISETSRQYDKIMHRQQWICLNEIEPDKKYNVRIQNIKNKKVRNMMYYTYEMTFYYEAKLKGRIKSSFVEVIKS